MAECQRCGGHSPAGMDVCELCFRELHDDDEREERAARSARAQRDFDRRMEQGLTAVVARMAGIAIEDGRAIDELATAKPIEGDRSDAPVCGWCGRAGCSCDSEVPF